MKAGTLLLLGAVGLGLFYFSGLGVAVADLQIILGGITIQNATTINIQLIVQNVSNATLTVNSMTGTVTMNNNTLGNISSFPPGGIAILPNAQTTINVTLNLSLLSLPGTVMSLLQGGGNQLNFLITGNVNLAGIPAPIPFSVSDVITY